MKTIHIAIGNSDDWLTQKQWSEYVRRVDGIVTAYAAEVFGRWLSASDAPFQNACWAFTVPDEEKQHALRLELSRAASDYDQEQVAWNESEVEMIQGLQ